MQPNATGVKFIWYILHIVLFYLDLCRWYIGVVLLVEQYQNESLKL